VFVAFSGDQVSFNTTVGGWLVEGWLRGVHYH